MPSMPKGCGFCDRATNELAGWEYKGKIIHLNCYLEFQKFVSGNIERSPSMLGAPKRSNETCMFSPKALEVHDAGRTLKWTLCNSLVVKAEAIDDEEYLKAVNQNREIIYGPIHPTCLTISLKAEVLRLYDQHGGR